MHRWLLDHRWFGRPLRDWERSGAIRLRVKWIASIMMIAMVSVPLVTGEFAVGLKLLAATTVAAVLLFLWTRPSPPHE